MQAGVGFPVTSEDAEQLKVGVGKQTGKPAHGSGGQNGKAQSLPPESDPEQAEMAQAALQKLLGSVRR